MSSKQTGTPVLSEDLEYLNALDRLRSKAQTMRDKGLEAIIAFSLEDTENWETDLSNNEKVLFRRAKHLAWNLGKIKELECDYRDALYFSKAGEPKSITQTDIDIGHYPEWPELRLPFPEPGSEPKPEAIDLFNMPGEPAPILFAANYLRTRLGNLRGFLDEEALLCYYRIIRELYNLHETNWALGAARPGEESGKPSVFVTTECTRAIGFFARLLENTADFLKRMHDTKKYIEHVKQGQRNDSGIPALHESWCASELEWCNASVKTTIESYRDYVSLSLPDFEEHANVEEIVACVEASVRYFVKKSEDSFRKTKTRINQLRSEERKEFKGKRERLTRHRENEQMPKRDLTETAHRVASGALAGSRLELQNLIEASSRSEFQRKIDTDEIPDLLNRASKLFAKLAAWLRTHLAPANEYFEKNLHRCLVENGRRNSPGTIQDLAFSALSVGLITKGWHRADFCQAIEILSRNLNDAGEFPEGPPFCFTPQGTGRIVINAQVIRAYAQIAQHLAGHLDREFAVELPGIAERMISYFHSHSIQHENGIAWPSLRSLNGKRSCLWITALTVLSLHRLALMLDAYINHGVKRHFKTKSPAELKNEGVPYLHELMCSDIGYVSHVGNREPQPKRVVMELERMRAHLLGSGRAKKALRAKESLGEYPVRSLILYGPPGTGKTTMVKSLAVTCQVDMIEVMSHDLYRHGTEQVMKQSSDVMDSLKLLTSSVVLFDEFEPILHTRTEAPVRITEMLTGNMLPKLDALYKAAEKSGVAYVLSTNFVERLDSAARREGRFDRMRFIYYPDAASRVCRLVSQFRYLMNQLRSREILWEPKEGADLRLLNVAAKTARCQVPKLCRTGWFNAPRKIETALVKKSENAVAVDGATGVKPQLRLYPETVDQMTPVWKYIIWNENEEAIPWSLFASADQAGLQEASGKVDAVQTAMEKKVRLWDDSLKDLVEHGKKVHWDEVMEILLA